jgi:N6-adenosine-specific RNA methylase IME4
MKYDLIYCDPPWSYDDKNPRGGCEKHYKTLKIKDLCELPVQNISADDSLLFMWATYPLLLDSLKVMAAWGYTYKTVAFTWIKMNKDGRTPCFGVGHYTASNAEIVLVGKRGKGLQRINKDVSQIVMSKRTKHSAKPLKVIKKIDHLYGNVKKIELFARCKSDGWDATGVDLDGVDIRDFLAKA